MNKKIAFLALPVMLALAFFSCEKEAVENEGNTVPVSETDHTLNQIIELTEEFKANAERERLNSQDRDLPPEIKEFFEVDAEASTWHFILNGDFDQAMFVGSIASLKSSWGVTPRPAPGGYGAYSDNYLDYVGEGHVGILHDCHTTVRHLISTGGEIVNADFLAYAKNYAIVNYGSSPAVLAGYTLAQFEADIAESVHVPLLDFADYLQDEAAISSTEHDILELYFETLDVATNFSSFYEYSTSVEDAIMESGYSTTVKENLLFTMATSRHDLEYWAGSGDF